MSSDPNRIQEQSGPVSDRQPTSPEAQGPLEEGVNAATKFPAASPQVPQGSEVNSGWRKRDDVWPEVHDPFDTDHPEDIDPRATGDPIGESRR
jgi:hypothetical protein